MEEVEGEEADSLSTSEQSQPSQKIASGPTYRKKLDDVKDWKRVLSRSKLSYDAVQQDALQQVILIAILWLEEKDYVREV